MNHMALSSAVLVVLTASPALGDGSRCEELDGLVSSGNTKVSSETVAVGTVVAKGRRGDVVAPRIFCRVRGTINGNIHFEVWLPGKDAWNRKLIVHGNGALAGSIGHEGLARTLERGYASAGTDTGHQTSGTEGSWALRADGSLDEERLRDWAHRSHQLTTLVAKKIVAAHYGAGPRYSYFTGCSGGGGHGLQMAQKYPSLFDGIEVGAPANLQTHMWPGELYASLVTHDDYAAGGACSAVPCEAGGSQVICGDGLTPREKPCPSFIPFAKLEAIRKAAVAACDAADGVEDGLIGDPRRCHFDPYSMVCPPGDDNPECLTVNQAESARRIYAGLRNPATGEQVWPGYEPGSEYGWAGHVGEPFFVPIAYFRYMVFRDSGWDWHELVRNEELFDVVARAHGRLAPLISATDPDLSAFEARGGKLILWHGWDDQNIAPRNTIDYYEDVAKTMGGREKTGRFARLFMVPGMQHCNGGRGFVDFDALAALEKWVEDGVAPQSIAATSAKKDATRPLCPYPGVLRPRRPGLDPAKPDSLVCGPPAQ